MLRNCFFGKYIIVVVARRKLQQTILTCRTSADARADCELRGCICDMGYIRRRSSRDFLTRCAYYITSSSSPRTARRWTADVLSLRAVGGSDLGVEVPVCTDVISKKHANPDKLLYVHIYTYVYIYRECVWDIENARGEYVQYYVLFHENHRHIGKRRSQVCTG